MKKDKELAVYDGVQELLKDGCSVAEMTVSAIANAAGLGKGTLYEYFDTKEEIVAKALIYMVQRYVHQARLEVQKARSFDGRIEAFLNAADEAGQCGMPLFEVLTGSGSAIGLSRYVNIEDVMQNIKMEIDILFDEVGRAAKRERILRRAAPADEVHFIISGSFASYLSHVYFGQLRGGISHERIRELVLQSLKATLGTL